MNKKIYLSFILIYFLAFIASALILSFSNLSILSFKIHLWIIALSSLLNLILLLILEYKIKKFKANNMFIVLFMAFIVFSVLFIYVLSFLDNFNDYKMLYLIINLAGYFVIFATLLIVDIVKKSKQKAKNNIK